VALLSSRNPAMGGGDSYRHTAYFYYDCRGRCGLPPYLQMAGQS